MTTFRPGIDISLQELLALRLHAGKISLTALKQVQELRQGQHQSSQLGRGMEFSEVRHYLPGDDVRSIDWKITARSNKPHTKLFQEEKLREVYLVVDKRQSMQFGTQDAFKAVIASKVAAIIAFSAISQGDTVGGVVVSDTGLIEIKPTARELGALTFCHALTNCSMRQHMITQNMDPLTLAVRHIFAAAKLHSLVVICSDFTPLTQELRDAIALLKRKHQVLAINISDHLERDLPEAGLLCFSDEQKKLSLDSSNPKQRQKYRETWERKAQQLQEFFIATSVPYIDLDTSSNWLNKITKTIIVKQGGK